MDAGLPLGAAIVLRHRKDGDAMINGNWRVKVCVCGAIPEKTDKRATKPFGGNI
ncbi:MAG: hypothetical protein LBI39_02655 [Puniceicoccales bacterium]|nr:hypothetical protein [Puniceicoccales bacterium]